MSSYGDEIDLFEQLGQPAPVLDRVDPLDFLLAAWLASYASPHTRRAYERDVRRWLAWLTTIDVAPFEARRVHVDAWARAGAGYAKTPAAASLARTLAAVSAFYQYALDEELTDRNPLTSVRRPVVDKDDSPTRGLTFDEAKAFLIMARERLTLRDQIAVRLMLSCGLREASVIGADVDQLRVDTGHRTLTVPLKGAKRLKTVLPPDTAAAIDTHMAERGHPDQGPLLVTATGARLQPSHVYRTVQRVAGWAALEEPATVTPHSLRHTFATLSLDGGAQLHEVQDAMGHSDPRTTRKYDRARNRLSKHPAYRLSADLGE